MMTCRVCQSAEETDPSCIIVLILRVIYEYPVKLLRATQHLSQPRGNCFNILIILTLERLHKLT